MNFKIAVLPGDGIGPEVTAQAVKTLNAIGDVYNHRFEFRYGFIGAAAIDELGTPLPKDTLDLCQECDAVLFGAIGDPKYDNNPNATVRPEQGLLRLRKELGLYTNIRPIKAYPTLLDQSPLKRDRIEGTDMLIYRELTGGIYFGKKTLSEDKTLASDLCEYSVEEVERIAHLAFKAAQGRRKKLTLVDKANVLETSRLWRRVVTKVGQAYEDVALDFLFVDNAAMQLILNPRQFDVILTENMFGDIISDEGSVIGGSIGLLASASVGDANALFEPIHGSFPQAKGKNIANPIASVLSAAMLLDFLKLPLEAEVVRKAVEVTLAQGILTPDLRPQSCFGTESVGEYIARLIFEVGERNGSVSIANIVYGQSTII